MTPAQMKRIAKSHMSIAAVYEQAAEQAEKAKAVTVAKKSVKKATKKKAVKRGIRLK